MRIFLRAARGSDFIHVSRDQVMTLGGGAMHPELVTSKNGCIGPNLGRAADYSTSGGWKLSIRTLNASS